mmetsp:Transcript_15283/g.36442  ORF Transcript_15283/g.36442 Transcript_15283/m.36442 type:complete len:326 (+) Transcript_15283:3-980(+)
MAEGVVEQELGRRWLGGGPISAKEDCLCCAIVVSVFLLLLRGGVHLLLDEVVHVQLLPVSNKHQGYRQDDVALLHASGSERSPSGVRYGRWARNDVVQTPPISLKPADVAKGRRILVLERSAAAFLELPETSMRFRQEAAEYVRNLLVRGDEINHVLHQEPVHSFLGLLRQLLRVPFEELDRLVHRPIGLVVILPGGHGIGLQRLVAPILSKVQEDFHPDRNGDGGRHRHVVVGRHAPPSGMDPAHCYLTSAIASASAIPHHRPEQGGVLVPVGVDQRRVEVAQHPHAGDGREGPARSAGVFVRLVFRHGRIRRPQHLRHGGKVV